MPPCKGWPNGRSNARFAWDSYRRFVQMYGNVVVGIDGERFEEAIAAAKLARGVTADTELDAEALAELTRTFQSYYDFPQDPREQLRGSINAVFDSWTGERAVTYRRLNRIPDDLGDGGQRPADGVREPGGDLGLRRRLLPRRGRPALPSRPATSCRTPRARTSSPVCARRATFASSRPGSLLFTSS